MLHIWAASWRADTPGTPARPGGRRGVVSPSYRSCLWTAASWTRADTSGRPRTAARVSLAALTRAGRTLHSAWSGSCDRASARPRPPRQLWSIPGIAFLRDWNENWPFPVLWSLLSFPNLLTYWMQHFNSIIFRILNSSPGIPSPPLALFVVMLKAHLISHSKRSGSR